MNILIHCASFRGKQGITRIEDCLTTGWFVK